jgi:hypothetical protein
MDERRALASGRRGFVARFSMAFSLCARPLNPMFEAHCLGRALWVEMCPRMLVGKALEDFWSDVC